ncbi:MAG: proton-conducting transporter membrane subunit [Thermofilaceae archaeon]
MPFQGISEFNVVSLASLAIILPVLASLFSPALALIPSIGQVLAVSICIASAYFTLAALLMLASVVAAAPIHGVLTGTQQSSFGIPIELYVDSFSLIPALLTSLIGALALTYNTRYLSPSNRAYKVKGFNRSYPVISLFIGSMLGLFFSSNMLSLLVFWELVSICSYALITFRLELQKSLAAGLKCILQTHVGGVGLIAAALLVNSTTGSFSFSSLPSMRASELRWLLLTLTVVAVLPKAVQYPLHTWLPDGVVAPTSATVLFHVCGFQSGVYVLIRFLQLLYAKDSHTVFGFDSLALAVTTIGSLTAIIGGVNGLISRDLKKVIAYGTISGLGLILMSVGLLTPMGLAAGLTLLFSHALCFSLLFFCAGSVIYASGEEDLDRLGGLYQDMKAVAVCCFIACLSLAAMPSTPEFVGKYLLFQAILEAGYAHLLPVVVLGSLLSAAIGARLFYAVFLGDKGYEFQARDPPLSMLAPILAISGAILALGIYPQPALEGLVLPALNQLGYVPEEGLYEPFYKLSGLLLSTVASLASVFFATLVVTKLLSRKEVKTGESEEGEEAVKLFLCGEEVDYVSPKGGGLYASLLHAAKLPRVSQLTDPDRFYAQLAKAYDVFAARVLKLDILYDYRATVLSFLVSALVLLASVGALIWK